MQDRWTVLITAGLTSALSTASGAVLSRPWLFWPSVVAVALVGMVTCLAWLLSQVTALLDRLLELRQAVQRLKHRGDQPPDVARGAHESSDDASGPGGEEGEEP